MSFAIPLTLSATNTNPAAKELQIVFDSQDQLSAWMAGVVRAFTPGVPPDGPADLRATIGYIERAIELHEYARTARSYVPELTGEQREYLRQRGYYCGSSSECCWFEKSKTSK